MSSNREDIERAAAALKRGELVAFPTETVYGLGADARSPEALRKLYEVKGRPVNHPVIVHLGSTDWIERWAMPEPRAARLAEQYWPGPLTLILNRRPETPDQVTGGQDTVGLRMPNHPLALELLKEFGDGLAAPSANRFGRVSPTTAEHVRQDLGDDIQHILDGGPCQVGVESTIVDLSGPTARVLRPGAITESELQAHLQGSSESENREIRAPGTLKSHYAPKAKAELLSTERLNSRMQELLNKGVQVAVWSRQKPEEKGSFRWKRAETDPVAYTRNLYSTLRELDELGAEVILIERPPKKEAWLAALDRLQRASYSTPT